MALHLFGTLSAVLIGVFHASGKRVLASLAILAMLACGGYGIINMIGFTSTNRVVVAEAKTAANKADERQYQAAVAAKKSEIDWTRNTIVNEESPREKRRLEAALTQKEKELAELRPPKLTAATVLADPQATLFARIVGWTPENWQIVLPILIAPLLWLAEVLSFIFAVHLMLGAMTDWRTATPSRQGPGEGSGSCAQLRVVSDADGCFC